MFKSNKKRETLSDKISGLLTTAPKSFDPEDDIYEETTAKVNQVDSEESDDEDVGLSTLRKRTADLIEDNDAKYAGKKGSRKSLKDSDEECSTADEDVEETTDNENIETQDSVDDEEDAEDESDSQDEGEDVEDESESDFSDGGMFDESQSQGESSFKHMSETNIPNQVKKGHCVRNQLNMWENLLEIRIQLQKCLIQSNKMPQYDVYKTFETNDEFKSAAAKTKSTVKNTLEKLLQLQLLLLKQYPETKSIFKENSKTEKKDESDEEIPSDTDEEIKSEESESEEEKIPRKRRKISDIEADISKTHKKYREYRNSVIEKWNDKTRLSLRKNNTGTTSIIDHIKFILDDREKLVKRTQLKRSDYDVIGKTTPTKSTENPEEDEREQTSKAPNEYDTEIFDDDDFYHQLLRELIEFKSTGITDPIQMSRQWIQLQKLRSKMKRKVDTRATKGRKIRYTVHSKLVNFMAPIDFSTITDEAKNDFFSSLFGSKM